MITTICDDLMKTDFDLYHRITDGFEAEILEGLVFDEVDIQVEDHDSVIYCHDMKYLDKAMFVKNKVVCLGERWNGKGCLKNHVPDFQKLYVSNNLDELRWIIKNLLDK